MSRNVPDYNLGLNALGGIQTGASIANQIIENRLRQTQLNQNYDIQNRQVQLQEQAALRERQQQEAFQKLAGEAFNNPETILPHLYAQDPGAAAKISEGIQQKYSSQYNTLNLLTKDTKAENKQATYDLLKPELQKQFPELEFGDKYSSELNNSLRTRASAIKAKIKVNNELRETAQGITSFNQFGEGTPTGYGNKPSAQEGAGGGATGALVTRLMKDNPGMSFTQALQQVQTGFRQNTTIDNQGNVVPMKGAVAATQDIEGSKKVAQKLGETQAVALDDLRAKAEDATVNLQSIKQSRELLDKGAITGFGADFKLNFGKALRAGGINLAEDEIANTETYAANSAQQVANYIKAFGSGTGLSDADRAYATKMAAGDINLDEKSMRKILDINERASNTIINKYSKRRESLGKNLQGYLPDVKNEGNNSARKPLGDIFK